jgi:hypothetical protein
MKKMLTIALLTLLGSYTLNGMEVPRLRLKEAPLEEKISNLYSLVASNQQQIKELENQAQQGEITQDQFEAMAKDRVAITEELRTQIELEKQLAKVEAEIDTLFITLGEFEKSPQQYAREISSTNQIWEQKENEKQNLQEQLQVSAQKLEDLQLHLATEQRAADVALPLPPLLPAAQKPAAKAPVLYAPSPAVTHQLLLQQPAMEPAKPAARMLPILPAIKPADRALPNLPKPAVAPREERPVPPAPARSDLAEKWNNMTTQRLEEVRQSLLNELAKIELPRVLAKNPNISAREKAINADIIAIDAILTERGALAKSVLSKSWLP